MRALVATLALAALLVSAPGALATDVSAAGLRSLAARAVHDRVALAQLRRVDRVDGRAVSVSHALRGVSGTALQARLQALARSVPSTSDAAAVRADAHAILGEHRYHERGLPRPLRRPLAWLGDRLAFLGRPYDWLADAVGGRSAALAILGAVIALLATTLAFAMTQGRAAAETLYFPGLEGPGGAVGPGELERLAAQRERDGDFEGAVRLRFRAGLLRLDVARAIRYRPSLTTRELSRTLRSDEFDGVARDFDEIVYGGREAGAPDAEAARVGWKRVLDRVRGRRER